MSSRSLTGLLGEILRIFIFRWLFALQILPPDLACFLFVCFRLWCLWCSFSLLVHRNCNKDSCSECSITSLDKVSEHNPLIEVQGSFYRGACRPCVRRQGDLLWNVWKIAVQERSLRNNQETQGFSSEPPAPHLFNFSSSTLSLFSFFFLLYFPLLSFLLFVLSSSFISPCPFSPVFSL